MPRLVYLDESKTKTPDKPFKLCFLGTQVALNQDYFTNNIGLIP